MDNKIFVFLLGLLAVALILYGVLLKGENDEYIQLIDEEEPVEAAAPVAAAAMAWQAEETSEEQPETPAAQPTVLELPQELEAHIDAAAAFYGLDPALVRAVIYVESRGQIDADNGLCYGLMQLNKRYADTFMQGAGVENITDPENNVLGGCWYLAEMLEYTGGQEALALMCYNMGAAGTSSKTVKKLQNEIDAQAQAIETLHEINAKLEGKAEAYEAVVRMLLKE